MDRIPVFVGLDYHQKVVQVCALDGEGPALLNRPCPNDWAEIVRAVEPQGRVVRAGIEACCGAADLAEELVDRAGWTVHLAQPLGPLAISSDAAPDVGGVNGSQFSGCNHGPVAGDDELGRGLGHKLVFR